MIELVRLLQEAYLLSCEKNIDIWQVSVDVEELYRHGVSVNQIRECLLNKFCKLRVERTIPSSSSEREFENVGSLVVPDNSCLVITRKGIDFLQEHLQHSEQANGERNGKPKGPFWDLELRCLYMGGVLIKCYRCPARNQETVLSVFQETGWKERIDDPLPMIGEMDPKQRLQDTIKGLNRNRKSSILKFVGDGTGNGVMWKAETPNDESHS